MEVSVNTETATSPTRTTARGKGPNLRLVPPPPKLSAKCAREHAAAEAKVAKAKKTYDDAVAEREKLRVRDRKKLPSKEEVVAGGVSLKDYKTAGGKVTAAMKPHVHTQSGESWTVKVLKPAK
jgi:hypothetical protein